ncbi:hypothetical protein EVAR_67546_1 [Eumeta japonica]|uniref:Uncharacterized protein n=1 Tax=Eumeta variegata TaxID=151549 RepID=A0A4C1ZUD2_EUMVA|nr:hypothetical protein EVAR_67546_1 [Eumeta japonica]
MNRGHTMMTLYHVSKYPSREEHRLHVILYESHALSLVYVIGTVNGGVTKMQRLTTARGVRLNRRRVDVTAALATGIECLTAQLRAQQTDAQR